MPKLAKTAVLLLHLSVAPAFTAETLNALSLFMWVASSPPLRGRSHITSALFGISGHPWWCCKHWSAFALTLGTLYIDDIICERLQSWNNNFFQQILFQWSKVNVDISHFLAVTKGIIMNISHIWCQTMLELGWFLCLLWIFIRHQLFDEPLVPY